jgi:hypothetical protein
MSHSRARPHRRHGRQGTWRERLPGSGSGLDIQLERMGGLVGSRWRRRQQEREGRSPMAQAMRPPIRLSCLFVRDNSSPQGDRDKSRLPCHGKQSLADLTSNRRPGSQPVARVRQPAPDRSSAGGLLPSARGCGNVGKWRKSGNMVSGNGRAATPGEATVQERSHLLARHQRRGAVARGRQAAAAGDA